MSRKGWATWLVTTLDIQLYDGVLVTTRKGFGIHGRAGCLLKRQQAEVQRVPLPAVAGGEAQAGGAVPNTKEGLQNYLF